LISMPFRGNSWPRAHCRSTEFACSSTTAKGEQALYFEQPCRPLPLFPRVYSNVSLRREMELLGRPAYAEGAFGSWTNVFFISTKPGFLRTRVRALAGWMEDGPGLKNKKRSPVVYAKGGGHAKAGHRRLEGLVARWPGEGGSGNIERRRDQAGISVGKAPRLGKKKKTLRAAAFEKPARRNLRHANWLFARPPPPPPPPTHAGLKTVTLDTAQVLPPAIIVRFGGPVAPTWASEILTKRKRSQ